MEECPKVDGLILFETLEAFIQDEEMADIAIKSIQKDVSIKSRTITSLVSLNSV